MLANWINTLLATWYNEERDHSDTMEDLQSEIYPLGDATLIPVGVDEEKYRLRFLEESRRLFASQEIYLEVTRVLTASGGKSSCNLVVSLNTMIDFLQR